MAEAWDPNTRSAVQKIPLLSTTSGPRDAEGWQKRLKEELHALIKYIEMGKSTDSDWFTIKPSNKEGTHWKVTAPEIEIPELEGKTAKMYRGGKICLTVHFKPLWAKNSPHFGIAHALCLGLAPWLAAEVPYLVESGAVQSKS